MLIEGNDCVTVIYNKKTNQNVLCEINKTTTKEPPQCCGVVASFKDLKVINVLSLPYETKLGDFLVIQNIVPTLPLLQQDEKEVLYRAFPVYTVFEVALAAAILALDKIEKYELYRLSFEEEIGISLFNFEKIVVNREYVRFFSKENAVLKDAFLSLRKKQKTAFMELCYKNFKR